MRKKNIFKSLFKTKYSILLFSLFAATFFLGVGYAQISGKDLDISGTARATAAKEVLITNIEYVSGVLVDQNNQEINDPYLTLMTSKIELGNDTSSSITYKIKVKNNSDYFVNYDRAIYSADLGYDNLDIEFDVNGIARGDILQPKEETEFLVTFRYKNDLTNVTNNVLNSIINFRFNMVDKVAKIGDVYFDTLVEAISSVPKDNTETTIELLKDTSEVVSIDKKHNIILNMYGNTISNNGAAAVIDNAGTLTIMDGTITSDSANTSAINNNSGTININGVNINVTGTKQALYNDKGTAIVSGGCHFTSTSNTRATITNQASSTMTIIDGEYESSRFNAVDNSGTLTIGVKDGNVVGKPVFIGKGYGINNNSNFNFYDGIAKGQNNALKNNAGVSDIEDGYYVSLGNEYDGDILYKTATISTESSYVAQIGSTNYSTISDAVNAAPNNTETTIKILANTSESVVVNTNKNIILDLNGKTLSNLGDNVAIDNKGILTIRNGSIVSSDKKNASVNTSGTLVVSARIISISDDRQAVYCDGGTVTILDGSYLESKASGKGITNMTLTRGTLQGLSGTTLIVRGGEIIGLSQQAISSEGVLTIGTHDGSVNRSNPIIRGETYGIVTIGTFNFYDGTVKGITDAISGSITACETSIVSGSESISGKTYITQYNS